VLYDDGDVEVLNLAKEKWILIESNDSSVKVGVFLMLSLSF
jgi:sister chromatid cohesion protein PDS5